MVALNHSFPSQVLPCPAFEGSEKRIEVTFAAGPNTPSDGLRALTRNQLDQMLDLAACQIVSHRCNHFFDAYVLSESSLFVFPTRMVLKTCGTTRLLDAAPYMLELAAALDMSPARVKYSRASYLFPESQPAPHSSFETETALLRQHFSPSLGVGCAHVLGDKLNGLEWHIFVAGSNPPMSHHTLEVCMTGLCPEKAAPFFRNGSFISTEHTTECTGIKDLLPQEIDDYVFEPCGYSMNGISGQAFSTIHITPESSFSYASFELCGYDPSEMDVSALTAAVTEIFGASNVIVALSVEGSSGLPIWGSASVVLPPLYRLINASYQELGMGGTVAYFVLDAVQTSMRVQTKSPSEVRSPRGVLARSIRHFPSFSTESSFLGSTTTDSSFSDAASEGAPSFQSLNTYEDVIASYGATRLARGDPLSIDRHIEKVVAEHQLDDTLYVIDLAAIKRLYLAWQAALPRVHPHYAVKCNPNPAILAVLAALGSCFDCANETELEAVLALGVQPERIVFANPCKRPRDCRYAHAKRVPLTTFDTEAELAKLARWQPGAKALLRIRADGPGAKCLLASKYGADSSVWQSLFKCAAALDIDVAGVSFHVGSGARHPAAFSYAIELAKECFEQGKRAGFAMRVLDVGSGFCGGHVDPHCKVDLDLGGVPAALSAALDLHFPIEDGVEIIAEPGRYFTQSIATLAAPIIGCRIRDQGDPTGASHQYWITDGIYGSMNRVLHDHAAVLTVRPLGSALKRLPVIKSTVFGPTCDGLDTVLRNYPLPELEIGQWLVFPSMGAYTLCGASKCSGINSVDVATYYVCSDEP